MAPIRWAASAPLLPPLRHLTRSIVQCNSECVSEITRRRRIHLPVRSWMKTPQLTANFIRVGLRASETIGRFHVVGQRDLRKGISETLSLTPANSYQLNLQLLRFPRQKRQNVLKFILNVQNIFVIFQKNDISYFIIIFTPTRLILSLSFLWRWIKPL